MHNIPEFFGFDSWSELIIDGGSFLLFVFGMLALYAYLTWPALILTDLPRFGGVFFLPEI